MWKEFIHIQDRKDGVRKVWFPYSSEYKPLNRVKQNVELIEAY